MKIVVGLGNPGQEYQGTRHNIGFEVIGELARRHAVGRARQRFGGDCCDAQIDQTRVLLLAPRTYMNLSGSCVQRAVAYFKLDLADLLIVCDDAHLPLARTRFRARGSAGGQKGLADILRRLGSHEVPRLRIGIGPPPDQRDRADYVLSRFRGEEREAVDEAVRRAADGVADWVREGIDYCMNQYNPDA
jgi:PTH1 family peptidyl-tRNA hydrolase